MKKRLSAFLISVFLFLVMLVPAWAEPLEDTGRRVFDDAGLLTQEQVQALEKALAEARESTKLDLAVVTTKDAMGKTATAYADDFYDAGGFSENGALLLIDMDNREATISTKGKAIDLLNDERCESILDDAYTGLGSGDYAAAAKSFVNGAVYWNSQGIADNQHRYDTETGKVTPYRELTVTQIILFGVIALSVGGIVCGGVVGKYRLRFGTYSYPFRQRSTLNLTRREDRFLHQTVTHRVIQTSNNSGGGGSGGGFSGRSSTHTSSSGSTHGGASRKF